MRNENKKRGSCEGPTLAIRNYKRIIKEKGWKQSEVAKMLGITSQAVSKKLNNPESAFGKDVEEEARKLGINPKEFFKEEK